jgi:hypothetical protein
MLKELALYKKCYNVKCGRNVLKALVVGGMHKSFRSKFALAVWIFFLSFIIYYLLY